MNPELSCRDRKKKKKKKKITESGYIEREKTDDVWEERKLREKLWVGIGE